MSVPFAVEHRLSPAHLAAFRPLLMDRGRTIDDLCAWVAAKGYHVSHGAIGRYRKWARANWLFRFCGDLGIKGDADARRKVAAWLRRLRGDDLRHLALVAAFLLNLSAAASGASLRGLPGILPNDAKAHRRPRLSVRPSAKGRKKGCSMAI
jgi:hypothetical protein